MTRAEIIANKANLSGAKFSGANLSRANLSQANFFWADLSRTNFFQADLSGTNFSRAVAIIDAGIDPRGYRFIGVRHGDTLYIKAGCRWFVYADALEHWIAPEHYDARFRVKFLSDVFNGGF